MNKFKLDDADVDGGSEQAWINKYRTAISQPPPKPIFKRMVGHLGYVVGIILGKSKRVFTAARPKPQLVEEIGIKSTKKKRVSQARPVGSLPHKLSGGHAIGIPEDVRNRKDRNG